MTALAYLRDWGLSAEAMPDGNLSISPVASITDDIRSWIREHKDDVLAELAYPPTDEHGPIGPCRCGCCSWWRAPGSTDWYCRECHAVELAAGFVLMVVPG